MAPRIESDIPLVGSQASVSYECAIDISCLFDTVHRIARSETRPEVVLFARWRLRPNLTSVFLQRSILMLKIKKG
jgi:hypothetical protein